MDKILIRDLAVRCILGINPDERSEKQEVLINIVLQADLRRAGHSDRMDDTVDYRSLKKKILALTENSQYYLVEALAEAIAAVCLDTAGVQAVQVTVEKPSALRFARSVGVEIFRERK